MPVTQWPSDPGPQWKTSVFWCWIWREANAFILGNCTNHLWKQPSPESLTGKHPATAEAHFEHFLLGGHQDIVWVWSTHLYLAPTGSACLLMAKPHLSSKDPNLHTNDGTSNMVTWWPLSFCKVSINQNRTRHISTSSPSIKATAEGPWQPNEIAALAKVTKP